MVDYNEQTNSPPKKQEFVHANASSTTATTKKSTTSLIQCSTLPQHKGKGWGFLHEKRKEKESRRIAVGYA
jgi:hypothetical protein